MECNRDEAIRAKSIAESKFEQKDYFSAEMFALKAQNLYPGLDGISHMLTALDVYISAENKVGAEVDWYGVLAVNPSADEEALKKQYRKMALLLHPDKNRSVGAEGAFKLVSEAWSFLSDKEKRWAYNQRRGLKGFQPKVPKHATSSPSPCTSSAPSVHTASASSAQHTGSAPSPHTASATSVRTAGHPSAPKLAKKSAKVPSRPPPTPMYKNPSTFWTKCNLCKIQYEYLCMYLNEILRCPTCKKPFKALETPQPHFSKSSKPVPWKKQKPSDGLTSQAGPSSFQYADYRQVPVPGKAGNDSKGPSVAPNGPNLVVINHDPLRKRRRRS